MQNIVSEVKLIFQKQHTFITKNFKIQNLEWFFLHILNITLAVLLLDLDWHWKLEFIGINNLQLMKIRMIYNKLKIKKMDSSFRSTQNYIKLLKSRRSFNKMYLSDPTDSQIFQKQSRDPIFFVNDPRQFKVYKGVDLFKTSASFCDQFVESLKKDTSTAKKSQNELYEPLSRKRDSKRLTNLSYKFQRTQRSEKAQKAIEDLKNISQISISNVERNPEASIRFNEIEKTKQTVEGFKRWRTISKEKSGNSKSPIKGKLSLGKRAKNSPKKTICAVRIRKAFNSRQKTIDSSLNMSTVESLSKLESCTKIRLRKCSITPWEVSEEFTD